MIWLLEYCCPALFFTWGYAAAYVRFCRRYGEEPPRAVVAARDELRPFSLPLLVGGIVAQQLTYGVDSWDTAAFACAFVGWLLFRNDRDDDDRWKRRRKKLAEKVAEVGGKLVLVPAASPP